MKRYIFVLLLITTSLSACKKEEKKEDQPIKKNGLNIEKRKEAVLSKANGLVSDPSVIRIKDSLYMVYSDYDLNRDSIVFNLVKSKDGIVWKKVNNDSNFRILSGKISSWDKHIETPELIVKDGQFYLYYLGHPNSDFSGDIYESEIGLATGASLTNLSRVSNKPVVPRGGSRDKDALTSPAVVFDNNTYYMLYTGWKDISSANGFLGQTAATSTDGINWVKTETAIFPSVQNTKFETATEVDIVKGPDGKFYLFFSAEGGIALARSSNPLGPWDIYTEFIIQSEYDWESAEVVAPTVLIENGKARIWYTGVIGSFNGSSIGYVEIDFPFNWD